MAPPTRTDDQIMPRIRWVPVGKSNCYLDVEKSQSNPIYKISVDILKHTNFFKAFTASSTIPSIYIQQIWDTIRYDRDTARYICQLDEQWFDLTKDTLRDALQITPVNNNNSFSSPPTPDALINFVNNLGYPKVVRTLSVVMTNDMFQPDDVGRIHPIHPFLHRRHKEYGTAYSAKEESQSHCDPKYSVHQADHSSLTKQAQIPPESDSPLHLPYEEYIIGYLKFSAKGTKQEAFWMPIPNELIVVDIQGEQYYKEYLEKVAKYQRYLASEEGSNPDSPAPKPAKATKKSKPSAPKANIRPPVTKPASSQQPKPKPAPAKSQEKKRKLDESVDEGIPEKEPTFYDEEADIQRVVEESLKSAYDAPRGPLPPVVIREPDFRKFQPLPEARPNPGVLTEGHAGSDPGDDAEPQPQSSPIVHDGPNLEHIDLEATDENLKLTVEEQVILEEPASSTRTLSSLQHLAKDFSFGDLFLNDKPSEAENEKTAAKTEAESMVSVTIQQDMSVIPPMTTPIIDLTSRPDSSNRIDELEQIMANLYQDNKHLEERLDSYGACPYTLENLDIPQQKSINRDHTDELLKDLAEARRKKKKRHDSPKTPPGSPPYQPPPPSQPAGPYGTSRSPEASGSSQVPPLPPPPPSINQEGQSHSSTAPSFSKIDASAEYTAWTTIDTRLRSYVSSFPEDLHMDDDMALDEHPLEEDRLATPEPAWSISSSDLPVRTNNWAYALAQGITELKPQDLEGLAFELVKVFHPNVIHLQYQMEECHKLLTDSVDESIIRHNVSKPLPLGGPPGQVTIQSDFFFNKDLEYLRYDNKGGKPALSILKINVAYYHDVGLEQMVPDQMWIEEECKHTSEGDRRAVRTHMCILSVVIIEVFSMYGYDYLKKIVLYRADLNQHISYLNYLPPKDKKILTTAVNLWTRHLVISQRIEDFQLGIESYQTQLNLTKPRWDATGFEYKHDLTIIDSPRSVTFRDKYGVQMIMLFNEIYKFSYGTLYQIDEALDYRVKEFKVNRMNPSLNTRF
nr:E-beta-farnesene synthase [Tanacetum cinerariifolium]